MPFSFFLLELSKVRKSVPINFKLIIIILLLWINTRTKIFNLYENLRINLFYSDMDLLVLGDFYGITQKVYHNLFEPVSVLYNIEIFDLYKFFKLDIIYF